MNNCRRETLGPEAWYTNEDVWGVTGAVWRGRWGRGGVLSLSNHSTHTPTPITSLHTTPSSTTTHHTPHHPSLHSNHHHTSLYIIPYTPSPNTNTSSTLHLTFPHAPHTHTQHCVPTLTLPITIALIWGAIEIITPAKGHSPIGNINSVTGSWLPLFLSGCPSLCVSI